jgi:glycosyltransferase involved in cell wall biosynthesis
MLPRISLITPSYQQAPFLEECLRSVGSQRGAGVEHIVVDGGSSDGSAGIIEAHAAQLAWWCSEADGGQSAAINKGLAHATGEVFGWLNSDDLLLPGALERVAQAFAADPFLLVYGGRRRVREADGSERVAPLDDPNDPLDLFIRPRINQQSTFLRMDAVRAVGGVEEKLRYVMDLELWWQLLFRFGTSHLRFEAVDLALFRLHGDSKTGTAQEAFVDETAGVLHGLCLQVGLHGMAQVLAMGHDIPVGLRPMPVGAAHMPLVRRMVLHFLLRWNHSIHQEPQFHMMRRLLALGPIEASWLDAEDNQRLEALRRQLRVPGWWAFRMGRKWKHLTR